MATVNDSQLPDEQLFDEVARQWADLHRDRDSEHVPDGKYLARIVAVELHQTSNGKFHALLVFMILDADDAGKERVVSGNPHHGKRVTRQLWFTSDAKATTDKDLKTLGIDPGDIRTLRERDFSGNLYRVGVNNGSGESVVGFFNLLRPIGPA